MRVKVFTLFYQNDIRWQTACEMGAALTALEPPSPQASTHAHAHAYYTWQVGTYLET